MKSIKNQHNRNLIYFL